MTEYHRQFFALVDEIEKRFPVIDWRAGDVALWPLARATLYSNICEELLGEGGAAGHARRQELRFPERVVRTVAHAATPLANMWRNRSDLRHAVLRPHRAKALFLGDGVSLDQVGGSWRDRYCDPLISELDARGETTLLMQRGNLERRPQSRPTFAVNTVINWAHLRAGPLRMLSQPVISVPDYDAVLGSISQSGVPTLGLSGDALRARAAAVSTAASAFERLLGIVRPSLCFMVGYFWGMGHALTLACRRRGILSIELQREGRSGEHEAYRWTKVPENGYGILPAVFWTWTEADAAAIETWTGRLKHPWHRAVHGGHPQVATWLDDLDPVTRATDATINEVGIGAVVEREILVALQTVPGYEDIWNALASLIETSPPGWRWWIRKHPSTLHLGDLGLGRLLAIRRPNVLVDLSSSLPLPALLRHMDVLVTATSGSAVEASLFGVKTLFLSSEARNFHPRLIESGGAEIVSDIVALEGKLHSMQRCPRTAVKQPDVSAVLSGLMSMANEYRELCGSRVT
jgi:hypothetical protein